MTKRTRRIKCVHFGSTKFDFNIYKSVKNQRCIKPLGGLWSSPIASSFGWLTWCKEAEFPEYEESNNFKFNVPQHKLLTIDSHADLVEMMEENNTVDVFGFLTAINFEKLSKKYHGIFLTLNGMLKTRYTQINTYSWDCETVLLLKPFYGYCNETKHKRAKKWLKYITRTRKQS